jgi:hypothetical protein
MVPGPFRPPGSTWWLSLVFTLAGVCVSALMAGTIRDGALPVQRLRRGSGTGRRASAGEDVGNRQGRETSRRACSRRPCPHLPGASEAGVHRSAELASAVHDWTSGEAGIYPGDSPGGVLLSHVEGWDPPVAMNTVVPRIDPEGQIPASSTMPGQGFKRASSGSRRTSMRPSGRFGRKACPRLPESRQCRAQNTQSCSTGSTGLPATDKRQQAAARAVADS